ncbi:MAG: metal ABC transporter substrate-binding protein, partial [Comamonadaceae bacterium]|nr:metal ABC transporter substrate-binding protein [Comamonadaceae bacterium]
MHRRQVLASLAAAGIGTPLAVRAQATKIVFGYTAVTDFATVFV